MVRGKCFFLIQGLACSYIYFVTRIKLIKLITVTKRQHLIENGEKQEKSYHTQKPCLHCHRITWFSSTSDRWFFPTYRWLFLSSYFWLDQKPHISIRDLNKKKKNLLLNTHPGCLSPVSVLTGSTGALPLSLFLPRDAVVYPWAT